MDDEQATVRFSIDPEKVLLFSKEGEKRIPCTLEKEGTWNVKA